MISEDVANAFVNQYYKILYQCPHNSHKFYGESSRLTWPEPDSGEMTPVTTLSGINEKILSSEYKDYTVKIKTVDSQISHDGGVIVSVTGAFIDGDQVTSDFFQTFFLAKQKRGFFVLNDILQVSDACGTINNVAVAVADSYVAGNVSDSPTPSPTKAAGEINNCKVESDISVVPRGTVEKDPVVEQDSNGHPPSVVPVSSANLPSSVEPASNGHTPSVVVLASNGDVLAVAVPAPSAAVSSVVEPALNANVAAVAVPAASAGVPTSVDPALKAKVASVAVAAAKAAVPSVAEVTSKGNGPSLATPSPNASQRISYASMVAKLAQVTSPRAAPITPKASTPVASVAEKALAPGSSASKPLAPLSKVAPKLPTSGNNTSDSSRVRSEARGVFVGKLPYDITKQGVVDALRQFGPVRRYSDSVQIRKYQDGFCCAFVEFESEDSASRAIKAHHVQIGENESYIAYKKSSYNRGGSRSPTRGGIRNGNGNRSDYNRGDQARGSQRSGSSGQSEKEWVLGSE